MEYYVYTHQNPKTKDVFYVGLGKGNRAWNKWTGRNKFWDNYVNKYGYEVEIVAENLSRSKAEKIEIRLIAELGRRQIDEGGVLVNRSIGGDGCIGYTHTQQFKDNMSAERKGKCTRPIRKLSKESKSRISEGNKGKNGRTKRPVLQYDKKGNFIQEYESIKTAKQSTGAKAIYEVCSKYKNQLYKSSGGFIWKYKE